MRLIKIYYLLIITIFFHCSYNQPAAIESKLKNGLEYYERVEHNEYGIPEFINRREIKPDRSGDQYILVNYHNGLPVKYYVIGIVRSEDEPDLFKPLRIIYRWTGKGFDVGYKYSKDIVEDSVELSRYTPDKSPDCVALMVTPGVAVGSTIFVTSGFGGFIIGVTKSIPATYEELKKVGIQKREMIIGINDMEYDKSGRLIKYCYYSPPNEIKVSETLYYYVKDDKLPYKSVNYSIPEKKRRIIYHKK